MKFLSDILWLPKSIWRENLPARCVSVVFVRKMKLPCSSRPKFPRSRFTFGNFSNSRRCFTSCSWKFQRMEPSRPFSTCAEFPASRMIISTFALGLKVIQRFKAKMEVFRGRKSSKVGNGLFYSIWHQISSSEMKPVFAFAIPNLVPNQCFLVHFARGDFFQIW